MAGSRGALSGGMCLYGFIPGAYGQLDDEGSMMDDRRSPFPTNLLVI
jgi:hypothetical protein